MGSEKEFLQDKEELWCANLRKKKKKKVRVKGRWLRASLGGSVLIICRILYCVRATQRSTNKKKRDPRQSIIFHFITLFYYLVFITGLSFSFFIYLSTVLPFVYFYLFIYFY